MWNIEHNERMLHFCKQYELCITVDVEKSAEEQVEQPRVGVGFDPKVLEQARALS